MFWMHSCQFVQTTLMVCVFLSLLHGIHSAALPIHRDGESCPPGYFHSHNNHVCISCTNCKETSFAECSKSCKVRGEIQPGCLDNFFPNGYGGCTKCILCQYKPATLGCHHCKGLRSSSARDDSKEDLVTSTLSPLTPELPQIQSLIAGKETLHALDPSKGGSDFQDTYIIGAVVIASIFIALVAMLLAFHVRRGVHKEVKTTARRKLYQTQVHNRSNRAFVQLHSFRESRQYIPSHYKVYRPHKNQDINYNNSLFNWSSPTQSKVITVV